MLLACISPTRLTAHVRHRHQEWAVPAASAAAEAAAEAASDGAPAPVCDDSELADVPTIAFPGGGIFFYWYVCDWVLS